MFQGTRWCGMMFWGVSVDRWLQVFQGTGWYDVLEVFKGTRWCGMVFWGVSVDRWLHVF